MPKVEQIRAAIDSLDDSVAKDTLALLLTEQAEHGVTEKEAVVSGNSSAEMNFDNFAQAINFLKAKYKFQELSLFTTEADLVYVNTGDRKVLLTDTSVKPRKIPKPSEQQDSDNPNNPENAFEPLNKNGRFSNLEL
ncbi:MAG: hypothetical protein IJ530_04285 [Treponema sp.]|uniref:hypothetical protein n=1 Tax=Treponema sp. TaxID=166 RepID=UPI0025F958A9|nr:hypothetical protein [Treponema sp.]MBQ8678963.1 hypothetical protein [Treponema sp.]